MAIGRLNSEADLARWLEDHLESELATIRAVRAVIHEGTGSPEGVVTAPVGHLFLRQNGAAATTLYVKESGANTNTGWVGK